MPLFLFIVLIFTAPWLALILLIAIQLIPQRKPPSERELEHAQAKARADLERWLKSKSRN